jgi:hypothetical protein
VLFYWPYRQATDTIDRPTPAIIGFALMPAALLLALAASQVRWLGVAAILWLAVLVSAAGLLHERVPKSMLTTALRTGTAILLLLIYLPLPAFTAAVHWRRGYPGTAGDLNQVIAREVSHELRTRIGNRRAVVLTDPTSTSWMMYFGGFHGIGTLYWENLDGLNAAARIYAARSDDEARALIRRHGITHLVFYSWSPFALELVRFGRDGVDESDKMPRDAFVPRLFRADTLPDWLRLVPYRLPRSPVLGDRDVLIYEVVL